MLIDKGISAGSVVTLKLVSGEEIIAKYVEDSSDSIKISKPMSLSMSPKGLGMMPFAFTVGGYAMCLHLHQSFCQCEVCEIVAPAVLSHDVILCDVSLVSG